MIVVASYFGKVGRAAPDPVDNSVCAGMWLCEKSPRGW